MMTHDDDQPYQFRDGSPGQYETRQRPIPWIVAGCAMVILFIAMWVSM